MRFSEGLAAGGDLGAQLIHQVISVFQTVHIPFTTSNRQPTRRTRRTRRRAIHLNALQRMDWRRVVR